MFLTDGVPSEQILQHAKEDLRQYMRETFSPPGGWEKAQDAVQNIDADFEDCVDVVAFMDSLLSWLERRRGGASKPPDRPWKTDDKGRIEIDDSAIAYFLKQLDLFWLRKIIWPGPYESDDLSYYSPHGSEELRDFIKFIAREKVDATSTWNVIWTPTDDEMDLRDFVSWLIVSPAIQEGGINYLHIIYDTKKISTVEHLKNCKDKDLKLEKAEETQRFEKILLHEIGHARTELYWYKSQYNMGLLQAEALPSFEYKAWTYCMAVRSTVIASRSWIRRLRDGEDLCWQAPF